MACLALTRCSPGEQARTDLREKMQPGGDDRHTSARSEVTAITQMRFSMNHSLRSADLPVEQPAKFDLAINQKTAKALGFTIPEEFILRVDKLIE